MRCSKPTILILSALALGCTPTESSTDAPGEVPKAEAVSETETRGPVHRFADNWGSKSGGPGCTPRGATLTIRGTIVVRPFGKGSDGAVLQVGPGEEWVLSYGAEGVLLEFDGKHVEVTGRACDKRGEAIFGDHFDLATLAAVD